jgi:DNA-binding NarL/FixJ family response regulator
VVLKERLRCLIVDDTAIFVDAAGNFLACQGISIVGAASTSIEAIRCSEELLPDITLIAIYLGAESGFAVAEQLHRAAQPSQAILISTHAAEDFADMIEESAAVGFLSKSALSCDAILDLLSRRSDGVPASRLSAQKGPAARPRLVNTSAPHR